MLYMKSFLAMFREVMTRKQIHDVVAVETSILDLEIFFA